jgi:hypothetical protein
MVGTILHECGHALWELLDSKARAAWLKVENQEKFADNLMWFCTGETVWMESEELWHQLTKAA